MDNRQKPYIRHARTALRNTYRGGRATTDPLYVYVLNKKINDESPSKFPVLDSAPSPPHPPARCDR